MGIHFLERPLEFGSKGHSSLMPTLKIPAEINIFTAWCNNGLFSTANYRVQDNSRTRYIGWTPYFGCINAKVT